MLSNDEGKQTLNKVAVKPTTGRRVGQDKGLTLVEWHDGTKLRRNWVKPDMLTSDDGQWIEVDRPERGIPYGDDFSSLANFKIDAEAFILALHERGVWTYSDVQERGQDVLGALHTAYGIGLSNVLLNANKAAQATQETQKEK